MVYTIKVETKIGTLPDVKYKCVLERSFDSESKFVSLATVVDVLHVLYAELNHRVLILSDHDL